MAISRARKLRDKQIREGKLDPAIKRRSWDGVQPVTKSTPTLQEKKRRVAHKHKRNSFPHTEDGSVYYFTPASSSGITQGRASGL
ncbi:hypothetical protein [Paenibacillus chitinolyticus]|uniref:Uncharacterized protein n=1 Tax=Paenibacillus chitinolyticus TaxID=79263 RepID=A0ABT4F7N3_9BACL|nr:hypothetical protein [Paenibacillus chitinolyticus]MCY9589455.1 hypothetical protein [Paenibacillus chitinolyticus]MCY9594528.1 hypothetical protein [Paenibacillus chitinolyticus]